MNVNSGLALLVLGAALGIMVYIAVVLAPLVFRTLAPEHAAPLMRAQFRSYYLALGGLTALAAVLLIETRPLPGAFSAVAAIGFLILRQILMPQMAEARRDGEAEDARERLRFARLHRLSMVVNVLQLAGIASAAALLVFSS
ncbi:MAG: DUF4149 domain-containing protein [Pseudomonadota bacterium]